MDYLLIYDYTPDYVDRRGEFRDEHLKLAWSTQEKGHLVLAGAFMEPPYGAVLHFRGDSASVVEEFVKADPYVQNGLVESWKIREWTTVVGDAAATPVRPSS